MRRNVGLPMFGKPTVAEIEAPPGSPAAKRAARAARARRPVGRPGGPGGLVEASKEPLRRHVDRLLDGRRHTASTVESTEPVEPRPEA